MTATRRTSTLAAAWMAGFTAVHAYWLAGGQAGLPWDASIYSRPALVVVDAVAVPLCIAGVVLARRCGGRATGGPRPGPGSWSWPLLAVLTIHALPTVPTWLGLAVGASTARPDRR